jgi:hypothetical protein
MCIVVEIKKMERERERERERDEKLGGSKAPKCEVEGGGSGDLLLLLFLCKEVSVLQQDCVYIETYIMAQLYAKLLLKFSFLWESVVQAFTY